MAGSVAWYSHLGWLGLEGCGWEREIALLALRLARLTLRGGGWERSSLLSSSAWSKGWELLGAVHGRPRGRRRRGHVEKRLRMRYGLTFEMLR